MKGYAHNKARVCTICASIPNAFIINGYCSICPNNLVYNGNNGCGCPPGKVLKGAVCSGQCQSDELLDAQGNCYTCGNNQVISNGQCVCSTGYALNNCGICVLSCPNGAFPFQGGCATCPLNTVFKAEIGGCACPDGFYKTNFGVCERVVLRPVDCSAGQYFDSNLGCVACPGSCKTCSSASKCLTCASSGYSPNSAGICVPHCGDGIIIGTENCDTGNSPSAGCRGCQIQTGWICSGQPSVCRSNIQVQPPVVQPPVVQPPVTTPTVPTGTANLYQFGPVKINSNNLFVQLKTRVAFTFKNDDESSKFIKSNFPGNSGPLPSVYCTQQNSPNLDTFDCLLIYPSGVPNTVFDINFSYNHQGQTGQAIVSVDPFAVANARRTNSRRGRN